MLGASPGASTAVATMISIVEKCFADKLATPAWQEKIHAMIPSYGEDLTQDAELLNKVRSHNLQILGLDTVKKLELQATEGSLRNQNTDTAA